jgi:hypothetical protein
MRRRGEAQGGRIRAVLAVLICLGVMAALPSAAAATKVVWGQIGFANDSLSIGVGFPQGTTVMGRVTTIDNNGALGDQVGGGPLCQLEFVRNGQGPNDFVLFKNSCVSVPAGERTFPFQFDVTPGPSRTIGYLYFDNGDGQLAGSPDPLYFNVAYRPQLYPQERVVRNGEKVKFVGAIPAYFFQPAPAMRLQVRLGKKWRTFKTLTVQNDGSYTGVYRFTNTVRKQAYKFRVNPIPNGSYPIVLSASPKATVIVKP